MLGLSLMSCSCNKLLYKDNLISIQHFGVKPTNSAAVNTVNLQKAIDWATDKGASLFVEPSDKPYHIDGGIILKKNVSLVGVHGRSIK